MAKSLLFLSSLHPSVAPLRLRNPLFALGFSKNNKDGTFRCANEAKVVSTRPFLCRAIHMESGHSGEPKRLSFNNLLRKANDVWTNFPLPVKEFPWNKAFGNFIQLVLDLTISVVKLLFVPTFVVSSISEMSYCAHERKLALVPFPLVIGMVVSGIIQETALKISPRLKEAEVPWHLITTMIFFTLIKLPGPYYPYWGRLFVPHFANGVLLRALWSMFFWFKKTRCSSEMSSAESQ